MCREPTFSAHAQMGNKPAAASALLGFALTFKQRSCYFQSEQRPGDGNEQS